MEAVKQYLKNTYQLSNYQVAQLAFLAKTIFSELSKIIIMGFLFHNHLAAYLFALFFMLFLRCSTGGLHFYTYRDCLAASILYIWLAIAVLPRLTFPLYLKILFLLISILTCRLIGPVVSKFRPKPSAQHAKRCKNITCIFIFIFSILLYIIPDNPYMIIGFWIIILHSLQLLVAKIRKKGDSNE